MTRASRERAVVKKGRVFCPVFSLSWSKAAVLNRPGDLARFPAMSEPVILRPGDGEQIEAGGASSITIKADSEATAGTFYLGEASLEPGGFPGPPPHTHEHLHDMFYVLEGRLSLLVCNEREEFGPGSFICIPPGTVHTFSNESDEVVRFLNFNTPGGWENYMRDLGAAFAGGGQPTREEIGKIASRYDFQVAPTPS